MKAGKEVQQHIEPVADYWPQIYWITTLTLIIENGFSKIVNKIHYSFKILWKMGVTFVEAKLIFIIIFNYSRNAKQWLWNFSIYQNHMKDLETSCLRTTLWEPLV